MKKILFLLILIIGLSPLLVGACTLAATPSGFDIKITDCDYTEEKEFMFDIVFEKDTANEEFNNTINYAQMSEVWGVTVPETLGNELSYLSIDNDFISLLAYSFDLNEAYQGTCNQTMLEYQIEGQGDINPYMYEDFKVVVLDMEFNVLYTSETYNKEVLPGFGSTYSIFIYDSELNTVTTEERDMIYPTIDDCGMFYSNRGLWVVLTIGLFGLLITLVISESIILALKKTKLISALISLASGIPILFISLTVSAYDHTTSFLSMLIVFVIVLVRHFLINLIQTRYGIELN